MTQSANQNNAVTPKQNKRKYLRLPKSGATLRRLGLLAADCRGLLATWRSAATKVTRGGPTKEPSEQQNLPLPKPALLK